MARRRRWLPDAHWRLGSFVWPAVLAVAACRAPAPGAQPQAGGEAPEASAAALRPALPVTPDGGALAVRYLVEVAGDRIYHDIAELWLPDAHVVCNLDTEIAVVDGKPHFHVVARAFEHPRARNHDREGRERTTERVTVPLAIAADIVELARLTARQRELARRVGERLAPRIALDDVHEHGEYLGALRRARDRGADEARVRAIEQRVQQQYLDWTLPPDHAKYYRERRDELDALGR